jgi:probable addiction module antidote protein
MFKVIETREFDPANYLKTQKDIDEYLEMAFESGDSDHMARALGDVIKAQGMLKTAKKAGLNRGNLYLSFKKGGDPRLSTLNNIVDTLGYRLSITPKGSAVQQAV